MKIQSVKGRIALGVSAIAMTVVTPAYAQEAPADNSSPPVTPLFTISIIRYINDSLHN